MKTRYINNISLMPITMKDNAGNSTYHYVNLSPFKFMIVLMIFSLVFINLSLFSQCSEFYGMTSRGGANNTGTIFKTDNKGESFGSYSPSPTAGGIHPKSSLILADNGKLYGITYEGGTYNMGTIFEWDPVIKTFIKWIDFDGASKGSHPRGSLLQASNGKFYGMTYNGGAYNGGVIFEWDLSTNTFIKKFDFRYDANSVNDSIQVGRYPFGPLMEASNGKLYGMTYSGGSNDKGVLFEWDPATDTYTKKFDFDGTNGRNPCGSLMEAVNGKLYGVAFGGKNDRGVIFEWDVHANVFEKKVDFSENNGLDPVGTLVEALNGKFYGITRHGGTLGRHTSRDMGWISFGVLFEWDPAEDTCIKKVDFSWEMSDDHCHSLMMAHNGKLYGMGAPEVENSFYYIQDNGVIYEWDPATGIYTEKIDFPFMSDGNFPYGLLVQAEDGVLYGMTNSGGESDYGLIFQWNPVTNVYTKAIDFKEAVNSSWPGGSLLHANNGKLYGLTSYGGANDKGVLFEFDLLLGTYINRLNFNGTENGSHPEGSLIQASDGKIYGMTRLGGSYDYGVFFEFDPVTRTCTKLFDFDGPANGSNPYGTPFQAANGNIYGMTNRGGSYNQGVLFEWDMEKKTFNKKIDFNGPIHGSNPYGSLIQADSNTFYGLTYHGGANDEGVLFEWNVHSNTLIKKIDFNNTANGRNPYGSLYQASDGNLYGMTLFGGTNDFGTLFEYDLATNTLAKKLDFTGAGNGKYPQGDLFQASNGKMYGFTSSGGTKNCGVFFEWDTVTNSLIKKIDFDYSSGSTPTGSVIEITRALPTSSTTTIASCDSILSPSGHYTWTASGVYSDTIRNSAGCDSMMTIHLTVNHPSASMVPMASCDTYTSPSGRYTWTSNGTYLDTIPNASGCDSLITINLQIDHVDTTVIQDRTLLVSNDRNASHQWIDCDNGITLIEGETFLTYTAVKNGHYAVIVSNGACADTSSVYAIIITGVTDPLAHNITLYPNPTNGSFTIDLGRVFTEAVVAITAPDGQIIHRENAGNTRIVELNLAAPPGLYMVTVTAENEAANYKVVKK